MIKVDVDLNELDTAVLDILSEHQGDGKSISRDRLASEVQSRDFMVHDRKIRLAIRRLRQDGHLICSKSGNAGGYYMATTYAEYEAFRRAEYAAKISDMAETMRKMDASAHQRFITSATQERLL